MWILIYDYKLILIYFIFAIVLALFLFTLSYLLVNQELEFSKLSPYECGFEPYSDARFGFDVRFYLVAILFLVFDLELSFLIPWCITLRNVGFFGFNVMLWFIYFLTVGFVYEWVKGALEWE
nr:Nad3 [Porphyridium purpureum]UBY46136.1 Nad3 [Porphyridium purpureum]